jgi:hypothetical protein
MSDETKTKKEGRYVPVLTFSLLLDAKNSMNPTVEVSKLDPKEFTDYMNQYMPDFDFTHDIANLISYCNKLIEHTMFEVEEYCGSATDIKFPSEPVEKGKPNIAKIYETIKKKKLN